MLLIAVFWYVGDALYRSLAMLDVAVLRLDPLRIVLGIGTVSAGMCAGIWTYRKFYSALGEQLSWKQSFVLLAVPAAGKYLPGKWFTVAGHVSIARRYGIILRVSGASVLLLTGMGVLTNTALGFLLLLPDYAAGKWGWLVFGGAVGTALMVVMSLTYPRFYWRVVNFVLATFKQPVVEGSFGSRTMAELLVGSLLQNGLYVCGLSLIVLGTMELPLRTLPAIVGASCLAGLIGFLAVFAPAGIGVREGVLLGMLIPVVGSGPAGIITILTRIVQTVVDLVLALLGATGLYGRSERR